MNNQKNTKNQQQMGKSQSTITSGVDTTNTKQAEKPLNAKQQQSELEYGTMTAKSDANNDYK